ncbi:MAG: hypothetical protein FWF79_09595 [Defluviitaleaceae bacterium]|nr:hypothetical protein [Defluviitaleaceae bacterium]
MQLPSFYNTGMVLDKNAKIRGWASPGKTVTAVFLGQNYEAIADADGQFEFFLNAKDYGGPFTLTVGDKVFRDVYIGRVWLCGGQSNMEERINRVFFRDDEVPDDPRIRVFQVEKGLNFNSPAKDVKGRWHTATGDFLNNIYAVPYFFARKLLEELGDDVPIGLICAAAGGTPIEGWLPEEILRDEFPRYYIDLQQVKKPGYVEKCVEDAEINKRRWMAELNEKDAGLSEEWFRPSYDDSDWESRPLLDSSGFPNHGSVWLRKKITLPAKPTSPTVLNFGRVENSVTVYVNGVEVVHIDYMFPPCACVLPKELLKKGVNTVVVRVVGEKNPPAIVPGKEYVLKLPETGLDLNTDWKRRTGIKMPPAPTDAWFYGQPSGVYNHMLAPLLGCTIEGLIWYQGESNTKKPEEYEPMFKAFVKIIRENFGKNLPVIFTQLANYIDPNSTLSSQQPVPGESWAALREQQRQCLKIPTTAMAVAIDCGEYNDLHPADKKTVGERLALHALQLVCGKEIISEGPVVEKAVYKNAQLTIHFKNAQNLWAKNGHPLLDIIDDTGRLHRLYATIKNDTLICEISEKPVKVRHGYTDCPAVTLYNASNLPASPFEVKVDY